MRKTLLLISFLLIITGCTIPDLGIQLIPKIQYKVSIHWLGHAGFLLESGNTRVYINPYSAAIGSIKGDIILISNSASDLCDLASINQLIKDSTVLISPAECGVRLARKGTLLLENEKIYTIYNVIIETVDAYQFNGTISKGEGAGFIITINDTRIYYAGLTDLVPELSNINDVDVAIVPIAGGDLTMDMNEAASLLRNINATFNIAMYYGGQSGTSLDAGRQFKTLAEAYGVNVTLLSNQDLLIN